MSKEKLQIVPIPEGADAPFEGFEGYAKLVEEVREQIIQAYRVPRELLFPGDAVPLVKKMVAVGLITREEADCYLDKSRSSTPVSERTAVMRGYAEKEASKVPGESE